MKKRRYTVLLSAAGLAFAVWVGRCELSVVLVTAVLTLPLGYAMGALIDQWRRIAQLRTAHDAHAQPEAHLQDTVAPKPFEQDWRVDPGGAEAMAKEWASSSPSPAAHGYNPDRLWQPY